MREKEILFWLSQLFWISVTCRQSQRWDTGNYFCFLFDFSLYLITKPFGFYLLDRPQIGSLFSTPATSTGTLTLRVFCPDHCVTLLSNYSPYLLGLSFPSFIPVTQTGFLRGKLNIYIIEADITNTAPRVVTSVHIICNFFWSQCDKVASFPPQGQTAFRALLIPYWTVSLVYFFKLLRTSLNDVSYGFVYFKMLSKSRHIIPILLQLAIPMFLRSIHADTYKLSSFMSIAL